jgi:hypothetical protein
MNVLFIVTAQNQNYGKKVIGINISAKTLDSCIKTDGKYEFHVIENELKSIKKSLNFLPKRIWPFSWGWKIRTNISENCMKFWKGFRSKPASFGGLGWVRGKNDRIDAQRIGDFTDKNRKERIKCRF